MLDRGPELAYLAIPFFFPFEELAECRLSD